MTFCMIVCFLAKGWKNKVANVTVPREDARREPGMRSPEKNQAGLPAHSTVVQCNLTSATARRLPLDLESQSHYMESVLYRTSEDYYYKVPKPGPLMEIVESGSEASIRNHTVFIGDDHFLESKFRDVNWDGGLTMPKCFSSPGLVPFSETFNVLMDSAVYKKQHLLDLGVPVSLRNTTVFQSEGPILGSSARELCSPQALGMSTGTDLRETPNDDKVTQEGDAYFGDTGFAKYIETRKEPSEVLQTTEDDGKSQTCLVQNAIMLTRRSKTWNTFCNMSENPIEEDITIFREDAEDKNAFGEKNLISTGKTKNLGRELFEGCQEKEPIDLYQRLGNDQTCKSLVPQTQLVHPPRLKPENSSLKMEIDNQQGTSVHDETINVDINASTSWRWLGNESGGNPRLDVCEAPLHHKETLNSVWGLKNDEDNLTKIQRDIDKCSSPAPKGNKTRRKKETCPLLRDKTARERFWRGHMKCCDESKPCPTAKSFLKTLQNESPNVVCTGSPPSDRELLEDRISLPYLPSIQTESNSLQPTATLCPKNCASLPNLSIFKEAPDSVRTKPIETTANPDDCRVRAGEDNPEPRSFHSSENILNSTSEGHPDCNEHVASSSSSPRKADCQNADGDLQGLTTNSLAPVCSMESTGETSNGAKNAVLGKIRSNNNRRQLSRVAFSDSHLNTRSHLKQSASETTYPQGSTKSTDQKNVKMLGAEKSAENVTSDMVIEIQLGCSSSEIVPSNASDTSSSESQTEECGQEERLHLELTDTHDLSSSTLEPDHQFNVLQKGDQELGEEPDFVHQGSILEDHLMNCEDGVKRLLHMEPTECPAILKSTNNGIYCSGNPSSEETTCNLICANRSATMEGLIERNVTPVDNVDSDICNDNTEHPVDQEIKSRDGKSCNVHRVSTNDPPTVQKSVNTTINSKTEQNHIKPVDKRLRRDLEDNRAKKSGNRVSPLNLFDEENGVRLTDSPSAKQSRRAYRSIFSMSMKEAKLEDHTEEGKCDLIALELKNPFLDLKRFKETPCSVGRNVHNELKYNDYETINIARRDTIEYINYLYARKPRPFQNIFGGLEETGHKTDDLSVLSNLHFCKVSGSVQFGTETTDTTTVDHQESDACPIIVSLNPNCGYLPPSKEELKVDDELAILNIMTTLKRSLELSVDCNEETDTQ